MTAANQKWLSFASKFKKGHKFASADVEIIIINQYQARVTKIPYLD